MQIAQLTLTDAFKVLFSVRQVQAAEMVIAPGEGEGGPDNRHPGADQWLYVVDGTGEAVVEGQRPTELRLAGISVLALAGLIFGWTQRAQRPGFALALQGGAIGGLLLTVFAAFKLYGLLDAGTALGISVVLIAGMCVLAVLQDSRTLAVLGVLAGFLAPIWLSTGSGNHVALFSYYAVLNAGIVAIAWTRPWLTLIHK